MKPIYGFMHICTTNHWKEIVHDQLHAMDFSGLLADITQLFCGVVGKEKFKPLFPKATVIYKSDNIKEYEFATLRPMHKFCKEHPGVNIFYIHTKGVSHGKEGYHARRHKHIKDYREFMEYKLLTEWRNCIDLLEISDICGVNWREPKLRDDILIPGYFGGNFYWAKSEYIASLPKITQETASDRAEAEFWQGRGQGKAAQIWKSRDNLYGGKYPKSDYMGKTQPITLFSIRGGS